jgi:membrane-associated phospholipid phosphatase
VNSVNRNYESYNGYYDPTTAGIGTDMSAAAATAAYQVMSSIYTERYGAGNPFQANFDTLYNSQMSAIATGTDRTRGMEVGAAAANAMITARAGDGWNGASSYQEQPFGTVGRWQAGSNPGAWGASTGTFLYSNWGNVTPFTMNTGNQFRPVGPAGLTYSGAAPTASDYQNWVNSSQYTNEFNQVKDLGGASSTLRTTDQTIIAYFWVDGPGTASPPGFGMLNLAEADVGIATWEAKVFFDTWRPMLAINTANTDGNPNTIQDSAWTPLIPTPSFGAYTSGHSAFSSAGAAVLAEFFGDNTSFTADSESPFLPSGYTRTFNSFSEAAQEAGMSRIYGGIHWMSDNTDGAILGSRVGEWVFNNVMQPVPEPSGALLLGIAGLAALRRRRAVK